MCECVCGRGEIKVKEIRGGVFILRGKHFQLAATSTVCCTGTNSVGG